MAIVHNMSLDPNDTSGTVTLINNNLTVSAMPSGTIIRGAQGKSSGKWYLEFKLDSGNSSTVQIGISTKNISIPGIGSQNVRVINGSNGNKYPENASYGSGWAVGDVYGIAIDLVSFTLAFFKNGVSMGVSHTNLDQLLAFGEIVPYIRSGSTNPTITINFGASAFDYPIPEGYLPYAWETVNKFLISSGEDTYNSIIMGGYTENLIPTMTSNTAPSGIVSTDSTFTGAFLGWRAFDKILASPSFWLSANAKNGWIQYEFPSPQKVNKYIIHPISDLKLMPKNWTFEGSSDGSNWTILDTRTNVSTWESQIPKEFEFPLNSYYTHYRFYITDNNGGAQVGLAEIEMFEYITPSFKLIKNPTANDYLEHGMDRGDLIGFEKPFPYRTFIVGQSEGLGGGKVFKQKIDTSKIPIKSVSIE